MALLELLLSSQTPGQVIIPSSGRNVLELVVCRGSPFTGIVQNRFDLVFQIPYLPPG